MGRPDGECTAILATDGVERVEPTGPRGAGTALGATSRGPDDRPALCRVGLLAR